MERAPLGEFVNANAYQRESCETCTSNREQFLLNMRYLYEDIKTWYKLQ